jgi:hypothetical protein
MFAIEVLIVLIGATMLWKRDRLAHRMAGWQRDLASVLHPAPMAHIYSSHRAWRNVLVPVAGLTFVLGGLLLLWKGAY